MTNTLEAIAATAGLFEPLKIREITFRNRIGVAPMCMYSAVDGVPNTWHMVHLGSRAVGGSGVVLAEATAVVADGRISPADTGIWNDAQAEAWRPIAAFIKEQGAVPGIQLAHAGRKSGTQVPWLGGGPRPELGWDVVGPSPIAFHEEYLVPRELSVEDIQGIVNAFREGAKRALAAGFEVVEIHGAHGYLLHEFLSPLSNHRTDAYGGSFENRTRMFVEVVKAIREVWPERLPLFARISATDWADGGWDVDQSIELAKVVKPLGVDLIHASSGGAIPNGAMIPAGPSYQVPMADRIRNEAGILTGAVGLITETQQAQEILESGKADIVFLARELLRNPYWPRRAAKELGVELEAPDQYKRAW